MATGIITATAAELAEIDAACKAARLSASTRMIDTDAHVASVDSATSARVGRTASLLNEGGEGYGS